MSKFVSLEEAIGLIKDNDHLISGVFVSLGGP